MKKTVDEIKDYWDQRAGLDNSQQSTTMDVWLRDIESRVLCEVIQKFQPRSICDVGCGDGWTTINTALSYPDASFFGFDYSDNMIRNANNNKRRYGAIDVKFAVGDVTKLDEINKFDLVFSTRCLINLIDWEAQKKALENIKNSMVPGGIYLMIENFIEGQNQFNSLRRSFGLAPIPIREHNTFFDKMQLLDFMSDGFQIESDVNISSSYYMVSRIIYSSICEEHNVAPDYYDIHHELAAKLPFLGEFGPVRAITFKKSESK